MEETQGCWREAQRADKVAIQLSRVRSQVGIHYELQEHITVVLREIESTSRLLRDLYDLFPIYTSRVPVILYYLNVVLPSLCKTCKDMMLFLEHRDLPPLSQWTLMYERIGEQGGVNLAQRFSMFNEALIQLVRLLSRCGSLQLAR